MALFALWHIKYHKVKFSENIQLHKIQLDVNNKTKKDEQAFKFVS